MTLKREKKELLEYFIHVAECVYDAVLVEGGDFQSNTCRLKEQRCMFINRNEGLESNLRFLANSLRLRDMESLNVEKKNIDSLMKYGDLR